MDVKDLLQSITKEDIIKIMQTVYGADYTLGKNDIVMFESVCHNSDSKKLYYYHNPKNEEDMGRNFICYVCGTSGNIIDLIESLSCVDFNGAIKIIEETTGKKLKRGSRKVRGLQLGSRENTDHDFLSIHTKKRKTHKVVDTVYDDRILDYFSLEYPLCWRDEGIDGYTADKFDIRYNYNTNQAIIPVRNLQGELVGVRVRNFEAKAVERGFKYMPLQFKGEMYRFPTSNVMYGLYENQDDIRKSGKVFLFEGEKSCMICDSLYDGHGLALAVYGSNFSIQHREILLALGVKEVSICFDKEYCEEWFGEEYNKTKEQILMLNYFKKLKKMCKMLESYFIVNIVIDWDNQLDLKDSPVDKGKEVFETLLKNKLTICDTDKDFQQYFDLKGDR